MQRRQFSRSIAATTLGLALGGVARAQDGQPIKIYVGFPPGGASDNLARLLSDRLREQLRQPVLVESRPGIGGRLATQAVKAAPPNGLTYLLAPNATLTFQHLTYPTSVLGYDMNTDLTAVARLTSYPMALVVSSSLGVRNVKDFVAWLKANPDRNTFGSAGQGGDTHFNGLQFGKLAGVPMQVVPYRGNGPLLTDMLGNNIPAGVMVAGDAMQHVKSGKLSYLGIFSSHRSPLMPEVPTMAEQGYNTGGDDNWIGLWAPARLPRAELERMQAALKVVLAAPDVKDMLLTRFLQIADYQPGTEVERQLQAELAHWGPIIKASGFTPAP
jgi:tripartite-type tricarboxylate transporter receptor subunit TctC